MSPIPVTLVGATGLTGTTTLQSLLQSSTPFSIRTIARRPIPSTTPPNKPETTHSQTTVPDLFGVPKSPEKIVEDGGIWVSCLGTTRAAAGGVDEQQKLDLGLNKDLAKKAKEQGAKGIILVSSAGTSSTSKFPYGRMKGQLNDEVRAMGFESCVILRPAMLLGARTESRPAEYIAQNVFRGFRAIGLPMGSLAIDAEE